jgi:transposase
MDAQMGVSKEGYAGRIEVLAGPTGRRRRSDAEKARIAAESLTPDAVVADIARRYGATRWQIYDWRGRSSRSRFSESGMLRACR